MISQRYPRGPENTILLCGPSPNKSFWRPPRPVRAQWAFIVGYEATAQVARGSKKSRPLCWLTHFRTELNNSYFICKQKNIFLVRNKGCALTLFWPLSHRNKTNISRYFTAIAIVFHFVFGKNKHKIKHNSNCCKIAGDSCFISVAQIPK